MNPVYYIMALFALFLLVYLSFTFSRICFIVYALLNKRIKVLKIYLSSFGIKTSSKHSDMILFIDNKICLIKFFSHFKKKSKYVMLSSKRIDILEYYSQSDSKYLETSFNYDADTKSQIINTVLFDSHVSSVNCFLVFIPKNLGVFTSNTLESIDNEAFLYGFQIFKGVKSFVSYSKKKENCFLDKELKKELLRTIKKYKI